MPLVCFHSLLIPHQRPAKGPQFVGRLHSAIPIILWQGLIGPVQSRGTLFLTFLSSDNLHITKTLNLFWPIRCWGFLSSYVRSIPHWNHHCTVLWMTPESTFTALTQPTFPTWFLLRSQNSKSSKSKSFFSTPCVKGIVYHSGHKNNVSAMNLGLGKWKGSPTTQA